MAKTPTETPILTKTVKAAAATEANRFVEHDGSAPTAGGTTYGVTRAKAKANERVAVTVLGTAMVATSPAAVAVGDASSRCSPTAPSRRGPEPTRWSAGRSPRPRPRAATSRCS